jgi:dethiobiotin synthetase
MKKNYFVSATHTDAGKTLVSALLVEALKADYWKPVQSGSDTRDADTVASLMANHQPTIYKEVYLLKSPESPHSAAAKEGVEITLKNVFLPQSQNQLIVEGAGGLMVPLNNQELMTDLVKQLDLPIILVVPTYLGCINHALMSLEVIKNKSLTLEAIIFNGDESLAAQEYILHYAGSVESHRVPKFDVQNKSKFIAQSVDLRQLFL